MNLDKVKIGLVQMTCGADKAANVRKAADKIRQAAKRGAQIICLQELFATLYFCQSETHAYFDLAESLTGPSIEVLSAAARENSVVVIAPVFEKRAEGVYHNSAVVIDADGRSLGTYRKMHIPDDPNFYEKFYFTPGDLGFKSFDTRYGRIGVLICWDQWFPEGARLTALSGARILFYPTAIGYHVSDAPAAADQHSAWQTIQRAHAVANGVFVAAVNRTGAEGELTFWGKSFVSDPFGKVIAEAPQSQEDILIAECDLARIENTRRHWPFLRDRRIDAFGALTSRWID
ncbi:MAG: carbon-nitrogen hydrolase [Candidatus Omnitrophica bacterium]|nr:carbon-nitrogen hydrolase [Candidatus Omnitrophota bacterium]